MLGRPEYIAAFGSECQPDSPQWLLAAMRKRAQEFRPDPQELPRTVPASLAMMPALRREQLLHAAQTDCPADLNVPEFSSCASSAELRQLDFNRALLLGAASFLTEQPRFALAFLREADLWMHHPLAEVTTAPVPIHASLRLINTLCALALVLPSSVMTAQTAEQFARYALLCARTLSAQLQPQAQNRLAELAAAVALAQLAMYFPWFVKSAPWREAAAGSIERYLRAAVDESGMVAGHSSGELHLATELLFSAALLLRRTDQMPDAFYRQRLTRMLQNLRAMADDRGAVLPLGNPAPGAIHWLIGGASPWDASPLLWAGALFLHEPQLAAGEFPGAELVLRYPGLPVKEFAPPAAPRNAARTHFTGLGHHFLHTREGTLGVCCPPTGSGSPSTAQAAAEAFSIAYSIGGTPIFADPASLAPTATDAARQPATPALLAGNGPAEAARRPAATSWAENLACGPVYSGQRLESVAGKPAVHERTIAVASADCGCFAVEDSFFAPQSDQPLDRGRIVIRFHLAPGVEARLIGSNEWVLGEKAVLRFHPALSLHTEYRDASPADSAPKPIKVLRLEIELGQDVTAPIRWQLGPARASDLRVGAFNGATFLQEKSAQLRALRKLPPAARGDGTNHVLYARFDYWNAQCKSGGSIGHTANIVKFLANSGHPVHIAACHPLPLTQAYAAQATYYPEPSSRFAQANYEYQFLAANDAIYPGLFAQAQALRPAFLYERPSLGNFTGLRVARELGIPYVYEYNGSEPWILRHWGKNPLQHEPLFLEIETTLLELADVILVVSGALRDELLARGFAPAKILVNPNGVDPQCFDPAATAESGRRLRRQLGFEPEHIVLGFIGSFGVWHGIPTLMEAAPKILSANPSIRLLMIGNGNLRDDFEAAIQAHKLSDRVVMTGSIPQEQAATYLAACDVFLSPHQLPPGDSRPFFGSPTKLFEYMAMNRPLIASALGQIAEVIQPALHCSDLASDQNNTSAVGILIEPGNVSELVEATIALANQPKLGQQLARNALDHAMRHYTWEAHINRLLVFLDKVKIRR